MTIEAILYIQIPFSTREQTWTKRLQINGWDSELNRRYADAVAEELRANADEFENVEIAAVRIGGGDASHIGGEAMWTIMRTARECFNFNKDTPVSMRCSLSGISGASMPYFKRSGVKRFDFEMLTLSTTAFNRLNETDKLSFYPIVCNSFLHSETNDSLGLALLAGSPKASDVEVHRSFLEAKYYNAARVFIEKYEGPDANDEHADAQIDDAREVLSKSGFIEYAPLRFAKAGCEDPFYQKLEDGSDVIGFGLGAQTRFDGALSTNTNDLDLYLQSSYDFTQITASVEPADNKQPSCI